MEFETATQQSQSTTSSQDTSKPFFDPDFRPLTDAETKAAVKANVEVVKCVRKEADPRIDPQAYSLVSFFTYKEPIITRSGAKVYAMVKTRGTASTPQEAERLATKLVQNYDSQFPIKIVETGKWFPICDTNETSFNQARTDVSSTDKPSEIETRLISSVSTEMVEKSKKEAQTLKAREQKLVEYSIEDDPETLEFYVLERNVEKEITATIAEREAVIDLMKRKRQRLWDVIKKLEVKHPEYNDMWIDRYNEERKTVGFPEFIPRRDQFKELEQHVSNTLDLSIDELVRALRLTQK